MLRRGSAASPLIILFVSAFCAAQATPASPATKPIGELKSRTTIREHLASVRAIEFSRDGRVLASADANGVILLFNGVTGKKLRRIDGPRNVGVLTVSLSPDGKSIATAHVDSIVRIWDLENGELRRQIEIVALTSARYSPDGAALLCTRDTIPENSDETDHVMLFNTETGKKLRAIDVDFEYVVDATFGPGGLLAVSGGESLTETPAHRGGKQRCHIDLFALSGDKVEAKGKIGANSPQPPRSPVFSGGGKLLAAAAGDWLVWETTGGKLVATLRAPGFKAHCCAISPSVRWIATGAIDSTVALFNTRDWEMMYVSQGDPSMDATAVAFNPDGTILAAARGRLIELFAIPAK